jgi:uncharacterized membrane protein (DUF373 family)
MTAIGYPNRPGLAEFNCALYSGIKPPAEGRYPMETPLRSLAVTPSSTPLPTTTPTTVPTIGQISRIQVVRALEIIQDFIVVSLCLGLFCVMVLQLRETFSTMFQQLNFHEVTADIMFLLILVELFRLMIIYLQEHRISIGVAVEVAIVSMLREVIVQGVLTVPWTQLLATGFLLMVMALLLVVRIWLPPTFEGVDPEQTVSRRRQQQTEELA